MPEVKQVAAILANPGPHDPTGRVTIGYYVLTDDVLTMTDSKGAPVRSRGGDKYEQKIKEGDNVTLIAQRLTMKIYRSRTGNDVAGFNRPLVYRPLGIA
jgi:hypothetical protein